MKKFLHSLYGPLAHNKLSLLGALVITFFFLLSVYAPFLASSLPIAISYGGKLYFPLFRFLFVRSFFTKPVDLFFNSIIPLLPLLFAASFFPKTLKNTLFFTLTSLATALFCYAYWITIPSPLYEKEGPLWKEMLQAVRFENYEKEHLAELALAKSYMKGEHTKIPSLWQLEMDSLQSLLTSSLEKQKKAASPSLQKEIDLLAHALFTIEQGRKKIDWMVMPVFSSYHWEEDAGGSQAFNQHLPWQYLTRPNRKSLASALVFGGRISFTVGVLAVFFAVCIGIPIGALSGYFGGRVDIAICRFLEIWESMPAFFMLLLVMAITQTKSIFLLIAVIAIFGWTGFSRYVRAEVFKQKNAYYVDYCKLQGYSHLRILFKEILPNSLTAVLTLIPFALVGAITSEAGLSFLGLGEENTSSWGSLMNEGREAFAAESYLLWPPAILLTSLLIAFALMGDGIRDLLDPRIKREK